MLALVWISEGTWESCVDQAGALVPEQAEVTLLHVAPSDVEEVAAGGREGLLGRRRPRPAPALRAIADEEAQGLLAAAQARLGRPSETVARRGRVEREVVAACKKADLLVLARDGEERLGPKSLGPRTRFVVDHAPCTVALVWARRPPGVETIPPAPRPRRRD
ncbi:MAG: universal stress protein [Solirubrobacterales bacterium]|nr:universal stress protein [Solirubrobacterales bacterium]